MANKTNRLASYKKDNKQVIVSLVADLRKAWEGKTLGEIAAELGIDDDGMVKIEDYDANGNTVSNITLTKDGKVWIFNISSGLQDLLDDHAFQGDLLDCEGRAYMYPRPVMQDVLDADGKPHVENGRVKRIQKVDEANKPVFEEVPGFNIGKPAGYRTFENSRSLFEGEMSEDEAKKALLGA